MGMGCAVCSSALRKGRCPNVNCHWFSVSVDKADKKSEEPLFRCTGCGRYLPAQEVAGHRCPKG